MAEQTKLNFSRNTIQNINIYREAADSESKTEGCQVKLSPTQKEALKNICKEHNLNASTILRDALDSYIDLFPYRSKLKKYHRDIRRFLEILA